MKVNECELTIDEIKLLIEKYNNENAIVMTKANILQRVIMQCADKSKTSLI